MIVMIKQERSFIREKMYLTKLLAANVYGLIVPKLIHLCAHGIAIAFHLKFTCIVSFSLPLWLWMMLQFWAQLKCIKTMETEATELFEF